MSHAAVGLLVGALQRLVLARQLLELVLFKATLVLELLPQFLAQVDQLVELDVFAFRLDALGPFAPLLREKLELLRTTAEQRFVLGLLGVALHGLGGEFLRN